MTAEHTVPETWYSRRRKTSGATPALSDHNPKLILLAEAANPQGPKRLVLDRIGGHLPRRR
jgi:hypothetical protein